MKESSFNVAVKRDDGNLVIANCLTHAVVSLDGTPLAPEEQQALYELGLCTRDPSVERAALKTAIDYMRFDKSSARLTICPTMSCNFRCPYCFQEHRPAGDMTEEVQAAVVSYVQGLLDEGIREIDVTWFGGEPLLRPDIITSLTRKLRSECSNRNVGYKSAIITNGYYLTPDIVSALREADPSGWSIQITLDGDKPTHDSRRKLVSGGGTYDEIVSNISLAQYDDIDIAVRVNVDRENIHSYHHVKELFASQANVTCYITPVTIEQTQSQQQIQACFSHSEQHDMWHEMALNRAIESSIEDLLDEKITVCTAEHYYSSVIDSSGYLYKCVDEAGKTEHAYAHIVYKSISNPEWKVKYTGRDVMHEEECDACPFIPICQGGCLTQYLHNGKHNCSRVKHLLPTLLKEA